MSTSDALRTLLGRYREVPALAPMYERLAEAGDPGALMALYQVTLPLIEAQLWETAPDDASLDLYQRAFRELEALIAHNGADPRHDFIVVIPVADRPRHLRSCLDSLLTLCRCYAYGSFAGGRYTKVTVLVADDSEAQEENRRIARHFTGQGLETLHFGLDGQLALLDSLDGEPGRRLAGVLGDTDRTAFYHKGPSIMRNISYLELKRLAGERKRPLFWFVDSDQEFRVRVETPEDERDLYAVSYFHALDRIFSSGHTAVLTGKVVGDPPVSPAVMAGRFLDDVIGFLERMAAEEPGAPCSFHGPGQPRPDQAAYHDMSGLFGFERPREPYHYRCTLPGAHDNAACLADFSARLNRFFQGEHPTRKTCFEWQDPVASLQPARTVYTGNYVITPEALAWFIPFATLRLRMAGPTLGRILQAELKERFVSANLPMLHNRTVRETGSAEFRPGISAEAGSIDLSGELERQYFGDVMLFTVEKLAAAGFPENTPDHDAVLQAVTATELEIRDRYVSIQREIAEKLAVLKTGFQDGQRWWNRMPGMEAALGGFRGFIRNIEQNFGERSVYFQLAHSAAGKQRRLDGIAEAIMRYPQDRAAWERTLSLPNSYE